MGEILQDIAGFCSTATVIITAIVLFVKPLREKALGIKEIQEGQSSFLGGQLLFFIAQH